MYGIPSMLSHLGSILHNLKKSLTSIKIKRYVTEFDNTEPQRCGLYLCALFVTEPSGQLTAVSVHKRRCPLSCQLQPWKTCSWVRSQKNETMSFYFMGSNVYFQMHGIHYQVI